MDLKYGHKFKSINHFYIERNFLDAYFFVHDANLAPNRNSAKMNLFGYHFREAFQQAIVPAAIFLSCTYM